jgi:hypothetical protein
MSNPKIPVVMGRVGSRQGGAIALGGCYSTHKVLKLKVLQNLDHA